jgi:FkbM family methyltransferase
MTRVRRLLSTATRRLASIPLGLLRPGQRAQVLERLGESMITTTPIPNGQIRFCTPSPGLISRASSVLEKEADTIGWIDAFAEGSVFWDIGANVGVYSLYASVRRKARVLAFEPHAANYHILTSNIRINELCDRVAAYCVALADETRLGSLNMASAAMGAAWSHFGVQGEASPYWSGATRANAHGMVGFAIDDFIGLFNAPFPNHVKIDVDGLELAILTGARATLQDARLQSILVELHPRDAQEYAHALSIFGDAGFRLASQGGVQVAEGNEFINHVFVRPHCN